MHYWQNKSPADTSDELINTANGNCSAWAQFFLDVLRAQGVSAGMYVGIVPAADIGFTPYSITVNASLPGQGNNPAENEFEGHAAVVVGATLIGGIPSGGLIYDPSYGATYASLLNWDDTSVATVTYINNSGNKDVRQHTSGNLDVWYTQIDDY